MRLASASGVITGKLLDFSNSDDFPTTGWQGGASEKIAPGTPLLAVPMDGPDTTANVANWGPSELVYVLNTGAAVAPGRLVHIDQTFLISDIPAFTGLTGRPVYVTLTNFSAGTTTRQGGWVLRAGICPVQSTGSQPVGPIYSSGSSGISQFTNPTGGRQIINATCLIASASTFTRTLTTRNGLKQLAVPRVNGLYIGQSVSGTGIAALSTIAGIDPGGLYVNLSSAMTAGGVAVITFTNTNFGICQVDRACIQGSIT